MVSSPSVLKIQMPYDAETLLSYLPVMGNIYSCSCNYPCERGERSSFPDYFMGFPLVYVI